MKKLILILVAVALVSGFAFNGAHTVTDGAIAKRGAALAAI